MAAARASKPEREQLGSAPSAVSMRSASTTFCAWEADLDGFICKQEQPDMPCSNSGHFGPCYGGLKSYAIEKNRVGHILGRHLVQMWARRGRGATARREARIRWQDASAHHLGPSLTTSALQMDRGRDRCLASCVQHEPRFIDHECTKILSPAGLPMNKHAIGLAVSASELVESIRRDRGERIQWLVMSSYRLET